jgi:hypothetical protein
MRLSANASGTDEECNRIFKLENELIGAIEKSGVGEFDGNEIGRDFSTLCVYGPSADGLFGSVSPILTKLSAPHRLICQEEIWSARKP